MKLSTLLWVLWSRKLTFCSQDFLITEYTADLSFFSFFFFKYKKTAENHIFYSQCPKLCLFWSTYDTKPRNIGITNTRDGEEEQILTITKSSLLNDQVINRTNDKEFTDSWFHM